MYCSASRHMPTHASPVNATVDPFSWKVGALLRRRPTTWYLAGMLKPSTSISNLDRAMGASPHCRQKRVMRSTESRRTTVGPARGSRCPAPIQMSLTSAMQEVYRPIMQSVLKASYSCHINIWQAKIMSSQRSDLAREMTLEVKDGGTKRIKRIRAAHSPIPPCWTRRPRERRLATVQPFSTYGSVYSQR